MPNGRRLRAVEILRALGRAGWYESSSSSGHVQLRNPDKPGLKVTIPFHRGREIPVRTVISILQQAELSADEFAELL